MNRNKFLASILALSAAPMISWAKVQSVFKRKDKGFKIASGEGRLHGHLKLKGVNANVIDVKISGTDTDGDLAIFEQTSLSPGRGTPLHYHEAQDEIFYVMEGSYFFKVGDEQHHMVKGDSIFLPRQVPHAWTQESATGKMMVILQPAGKLEDFFVTMSSMDHEPTQEEMIRAFNSNGMKVVGPPLKIQ